MSKISIQNICHSFQLPDKKALQVLQNINLDIESGDFVVILGESGCGKSTLLNLIAGLILPDSGVIKMDEIPIKKPHFSRSLIFQRASLLPWLNVTENIVFGCKLRNDRKDLSRRVHDIIKMIGLEGFEKNYPQTLSLGMERRVTLARALISPTEILLLDEPFNALDWSTRAHLQNELLKIWKIKKYTMILVTHDIEEAVILGNKVVILENKPTSIGHVIINKTPFPRTNYGNELFELKNDIRSKLSRL